MQNSDEVKITAFIPRELWGQTKLLATRRNTSARDIIAKALEAYIRAAEKEKGGQKR
jgi:hypothetical protein